MMRRAFTLVEVLVVVTIIAILAAVVMPNLASAASPMPGTIARVLEVDMRRASIEAIGRVEAVVLVVTEERDGWWIAEQDALATPIPGTFRRLGSGPLEPFAGYTLEIDADGTPLSPGDVMVAGFDSVGARDPRTLEVRLMAPETPDAVATWFLEAQCTKFMSQ
jgi:prepilin-type N-terminal cleavage/methylation domain-containing protein